MTEHKNIEKKEHTRRAKGRGGNDVTSNKRKM